MLRFPKGAMWNLIAMPQGLRLVKLGFFVAPHQRTSACSQANPQAHMLYKELFSDSVKL